MLRKWLEARKWLAAPGGSLPVGRGARARARARIGVRWPWSSLLGSLCSTPPKPPILHTKRGTNKAVKARLRPWLELFLAQQSLKPFKLCPPRSAADPEDDSATPETLFSFGGTLRPLSAVQRLVCCLSFPISADASHVGHCGREGSEDSGEACKPVSMPMSPTPQRSSGRGERETTGYEPFDPAQDRERNSGLASS